MNFDAPVAANSCGTFFVFRYFCTAAFDGVPSSLEREQHFVALDQLAHLLDRLGRAVGVVILDQIDLAALHAALIVDHLHIGGLGLADGGIGGSGPAERMVWPILISVSVAPVSYFFCAEAGDAESAIATAVPVSKCRKPFLMSLRSSYVLIGRRSPSMDAADAIAAKILEEGMPQCKTMPAGKVNEVTPARAGSARRRRALPAHKDPAADGGGTVGTGDDHAEQEEHLDLESEGRTL